MEKEASPSISSQDVTLAAHGFEQRVDEKTLFCTPDPQAASTVVRELNRLQVPSAFANKGSFLDDMSRLSLQSVSGLDLTHQLNFNLTSEASPRERRHAVEDSGPDLIQFSGNTEAGSSDQDNKSDSQTDTSSRSSMGLIPSDMLNDCDLLKSLSGTELSASVLPLSTSKMAEPSSEARSKEVDASHSTLREKTANSKDWSDSSKQDSKQDSKDMPWGRSQLETVKKRPQPTNNGREGGPRGLAARGAVALFAGHLLDDVAEGEELDQSMHNVELGEDDLKQLDADVDFSDLEDDPVLGGESGDEDFDFDGPMLSLPTRGRVQRREQENQEERTLQAELAEAESRVGEGQESEENGAVAQPAVSSASDHAIDSRYFRKTPMSFAGDGEDREFVSSGSNLFDSSQQRGAAEGEHLLTKLRRQFMAGDGSENEVDTDDELEAVKKSLALATRERGQGADEEDSDRSNLPLPVGLEDVNSSDSQSHGSKRNEEQASEFFLTRQRAEGNAGYSPVPWSGAEEGDGSSEGDSEGSRGKVSRTADRLQFRYVSGASMDPNQPAATDQSLIPPSDPAAKSGLQPEFFLPTSSDSMLQDSEVISAQTLEGSTFNVEDILKSATEVLPSVAKDKGRNASRTDASGFSAKDVPGDLFEGQFANSFGSFGLGPEEEEVDSGATGRSMEKSSGGAELSRSTGEEALSSAAEVSAKNAMGGLPSKGSGSFDGPFRKPRAPAPPRKKTFTKEAEPGERSETWKNAVFQGTDVLGESHMDRELRELGIHLDDDEFQTGEGAVAMLDADEKEFEEDNKFSQHHHLALAAEGLAWEGEQSCFSGFLGGEESPDNTETSIGTYMAARTEPLGTLGGDPSIPRPEFGKSLSSPPHHTNRVKLMSPPSTCSSMLSCRTEGEGDEEADETMVCGDSTHHSAESPDHLLSQEAPKPVSTETCEDRAAAEPTLRLGELSSMLLDLTQGGGDITMEDVLSNSAVLDFVKNNSYSNPLDFVSAIMKLSHTKKQQQQGCEGGSDSISKEQLSPGAEDLRKRNEKPVTGSSRDKARREGLPAHSTSSSGMSKPASASSLSQRGRGSRLPVCAGRASSAGGKGSGKKGDIKVDKNRSRVSVSGGSAPGRRSQSEQRRDGDSAKRDVGKQRVDQIPKGAASGDVPLVVSVSGDRRSKQFSSRESVSGSMQRPGLVKTDALSKKTNRTHFEKEQPHVSGSPKSNDDLKSQIQSKPQRERDLGLNVLTQDQRSDDSRQDLGDNLNMNSMNTVDSARYLNIPDKAGKDTEGTELRGKFMSQQKDSALHTDEGEVEEGEKWKDSDQPSMLLTPTQRLPASSAAATSAGTSQPEARRPGSLHPVPPTHPSSTGQLTLQPAGDPALAAPGCTGPLDFTAADSRPLDVSSIIKGSQPPPPLVSQDAARRLDASLRSFPATSQPQGQPTLLTGSSLLRTEFAQKYLTPAARGQGGAEPGQHPGGMNVTSSHFPSERRVVPTLSAYTPSQSAQVYGSHPQLQPNSVPGQRCQLPSSTAPAVDELAMSVYYELNEDMEQSTMLGVEGSALGSFWGKSPLYQSTPALELGRMAAISMTGSRLDEQELTTPGTNMVSPRVQRQLIQIQRTLDFPEFCCLGVSQKTVLPVTNRTSYGVTCRFRLVRLFHQGNPIKMDQQTPFELKPKISIGAGASENVPVLFVPKRAGEHVCQIEVYAQSMNPSLEPTVSVVQLTATAEIPNIQVSPSVEVLDLGEVTWGGCQSRTIRMRNTKKASLPVRLSIWSGNSVWHCFTFDSCDNSSDRSIISMTSRPESLGRNVVTVTLPGCDSPDAAEIVEFTLYCRPPKKDHSRAVAERPADQIDAKIDIEVDTPVKYLPPLSSIFLKTTVGMPRLLIPTSHMSLTFRTKPNKSMQESIRINNAGNITLNLALSVSNYLECFEISASRLTIKPGASEQVAVVFSPQGGDVSHYQSLLQLDVEPEGPSYEIPLEGQVAGLRAQCRAALNMMASTSFLSFHGVSLNQTRSLTIRLYNKDHTCAEHACVEIRRSSDCFKLVSTSGEWQQECDVVIEPRQTITLTVIFCPTAVQGYSGKLVIRKPDTHSTKYSIGLAGYGGRSVLALSGACLTNSGQRWLELGPLSMSCNIMREIVLTNTGVRAAFIRASAFYDMPCQQPVAPGRVAMEPNNFVLAPGCSMKVVVAISPTQREVDLVKVRKEVVAVVRFQHGDEVVRQKYLRAFSRDGGGGDTRSGQAAFRQPFANEAQDSVVLEGSSVVDSPDDTKAFFNHLESMCVALLGQPSPSQHTSMSVTSQLHTPSALGDSTSSLPTHDQTYPNLREDSRGPNSTVQFLVPGRPDSDGEDWTVKPDFLSLTVGEKNQKTLQLINFSKQPVSFELSWPSNSVVPEPQKGELKPRSRRSVEVWLHMSWQQRLSELPWRGVIIVTCNGQEKSVRVTVQKPAQSPRLPLSAPHTLAGSPGMSSSDTASHSLRLASTSIHFAKARVNAVHESVLELTNASVEPVQLKLSPFAPTYVKRADETNTVKRVSYSAFTFTSVTADLLPQETVKLPVKFCPQTKGMFNQHWEIEYWPLESSKKAGQAKMSTRISLTAEVTEQEVSSKKPTWDPVEQDKAGVSTTRTPLQEKHPNTIDAGDDRGSAPAPDLHLLQSDVTFSKSKVGQVTQVKIEFKNSLDHDVHLEVDPPSAPFFIKHRTFKITKKRILKYPITFSPSATGSFADSMVFRALDLGKTFRAHLKGTAV